MQRLSSIRITYHKNLLLILRPEKYFPIEHNYYFDNCHPVFYNYMAKKAEFASRLGLIAATVGSAVGLGNVWRFPAEAQANGGAAFLVVYILCVALLGIPVMLAEFALGRAGRSDAIGVFINLKSSKKWLLVGGMAILASYMILWFYMVVAGWTFEYFWQSLTGVLYEPIDGITTLEGQFSARMKEFVCQPWNPLVNTYIILVINILVLLAGVQKGIERLSNLLMPLLFLILLIFAGVALTLPAAGEGLAYFFHPDFSKITPSVVLNALGQAFFSLSLGMGVLITYSSYFPKQTKLMKTAVTVSGLDLLVSVMMGIIIFPAVMSFNLEGESLEGATLVFVTLPEVFAEIPWSCFWSALFFLLLFVAALTSTISIAEVTVAMFQDRFKFSRRSSVLATIIPLFFFSAICSLSQGPLEGIKIFGMTIFDFADNFASNILLPLGSLLLCIYMGWFAPGDLLRKQLTNEGTLKSHWVGLISFIIRYLAPALIFLVLISPILY